MNSIGTNLTARLKWVACTQIHGLSASYQTILIQWATAYQFLSSFSAFPCFRWWGKERRDVQSFLSSGMPSPRPGGFPEPVQPHRVFPSMLCHPGCEQLPEPPQCFHTPELERIVSSHPSQSEEQPKQVDKRGRRGSGRGREWMKGQVRRRAHSGILLFCLDTYCQSHYEAWKHGLVELCYLYIHMYLWITFLLEVSNDGLTNQLGSTDHVQNLMERGGRNTCR